MSSKLRKQDQPDHVSVGMAGPSCKSRQQDDVPSGRGLCDDLLNDLKLRIGVVGEIRALLLRNITNPPTLATIAKGLEVSDRSLRRQLREQGISFRGLLDELRMQIALKYLRTTRLANEDIALALGFSDATNFRRAFRRWTNKSPSEIRGE
jgi:AraC-like DNA-binding protein